MERKEGWRRKKTREQGESIQERKRRRTDKREGAGEGEREDTRARGMVEEMREGRRGGKE